MKTGSYCTFLDRCIHYALDDCDGRNYDKCFINIQNKKIKKRAKLKKAISEMLEVVRSCKSKMIKTVIK
jgi:hypothetical protein